MSGEKISRRNLLKYTLTGIICGVVAGVGGWFAGSAAIPPAKTLTETVTKTAAAETITKTTTITAPPTTITKTVVPTPPKVIRIGGTVAMSGPYETMSKPFGKLTKEWGKMVNERGGIYVKEYGARLPVEIIVYDDTSSPTKAAELYERLITVDKVDILIGPFSSLVTAGVIPIVEKYEMPMVMCEANSPKLYEGRPKWIVGVLDYADYWSRPYFTALKERVKAGEVKTIAFLVSDDPHHVFVAKGSRGYAEEIGLKIVYDETFARGTTDFTAVIAKLKDLNPDIVYLAAFPDIGIPFMKQAREFDLNPREFHVAKMTKPILDALGPAAEYITSEIYWVSSIPYEGREFFMEVLDRTGIIVEEWMEAAVHFAALQVIYKGIEVAGTLDKTKLRDTLRRLYVMTIFGPMRFDEIGKGTANPFFTQIQGGKHTIVWPLEIAAGEWKFPRPTWKELLG